MTTQNNNHQNKSHPSSNEKTAKSGHKLTPEDRNKAGQHSHGGNK